MALTTEVYPANGSVKAFVVQSEIPSQTHVRVDFYYDNIDHEIQDTDTTYGWAVINNSIVFDTAPIDGWAVKITVSTDGLGLGTAPTDISNVASNIDKVINVSDNMTSIQNVESNVTNINEVANISSNIVDVTSEPLRSDILNAENNATNAQDAWDAFRTRYYGVSASDPVVDPTGGAMTDGDLYFNSIIKRMKVFTGSVWIEAGSSVNGLVEYQEFTATQGQVLFTGLTYDIGSIRVYRNGYKLRNADFTATDGLTVTLVNQTVNAGDEISFEAFGAFDSGVLTSMLNDITTNRADIDSNDTDIAQLQSDLATTNANVATNTSDIATANANIASNDTELADHEARITAVEGVTVETLPRHGAKTTTPIVTINANPALYDIKAFDYEINGTAYSYAGATGIAHTMNAGDFNIIYVDGTASAKTQATFLIAGDVSTKLEIGRIATDDGTNITSIGDSAFLTNDFIMNTYARWKFFEGTLFSSNAGLITEFGTGQLQIQGGFISDNNGNIESISSESQLDVFPVYSVTGSTGIRPLVVDMTVPDTQYDDGTDLATIPNNKFVAHTLFRSMGTGRYYLEYGRILYDSLVQAQLGVTENNYFSQDGSEVEPLARIIVLDGGGIQDIRDVRGQPTTQSSDVISVLGWKDNINPFSSALGNGVTEPNWADIGNGLFAYHWTTGEKLFTQFHVDHDYALGTPCFPHVHFFCKQAQANGNAVTWRLTYTIAKGHSQGESLTVAPTVIDMTYTYDGTEVAGEHIIVEVADIDAFDLKEPDTVVIMCVELLSETATGDIVGLMADLHYQSDRETTPYRKPNFLTGVI